MQAPPIIEPVHRPRSHAWALIAFLSLLVGGIVLFCFNPATHAFYPRCTLYVTTGLYCPGCGSQRAVYQLLHGHFAAALRCNAILVLSLPFLGFFSGRYAWRWLTGKPLPSLALQSAMLKLLFAILIVFTILRNIHLAPFMFLAPP